MLVWFVIYKQNKREETSFLSSIWTYHLVLTCNCSHHIDARPVWEDQSFWKCHIAVVRCLTAINQNPIRCILAESRMKEWRSRIQNLTPDFIRKDKKKNALTVKRKREITCKYVFEPILSVGSTTTTSGFYGLLTALTRSYWTAWWLVLYHYNIISVCLCL